MNDDFLDWLDEHEDPVDRGAEGWMCDTIDKAEGAARRLRQATDKISEIDATKTRLINDATVWRDEAAARYESVAATERSNLETFLRVQIKDGGPKSAPLPWGVNVKARKTGGTLDLSGLKPEDAPEEIVKQKPSIVADEAKKYFRIIGPDGVEVDGDKVKVEAGKEYTVIDPNGEVVESVSVKPAEDKFEVVA